MFFNSTYLQHTDSTIINIYDDPLNSGLEESVMISGLKLDVYLGDALRYRRQPEIGLRVYRLSDGTAATAEDGVFRGFLIVLDGVGVKFTKNVTPYLNRIKELTIRPKMELRDQGIFGGSDNWVFDPDNAGLSAILNGSLQDTKSRFEWQQYLFNHYGALEEI